MSRRNTNQTASSAFKLAPLTTMIYKLDDYRDVIQNHQKLHKKEQKFTQ